MVNLIRFREISGVPEIEQLVRTSDRMMLDERQEMWRKIHDTSLKLFGITERDTWYASLPPEARPPTQEEWEIHFEFLEYEYDEEDQFWSAFGLDMRDEGGAELRCVEVFGRQLVCAVKRLHPRAALLFASGHEHEDQIKAVAEAWGRKLLGKGRDEP